MVRTRSRSGVGVRRSKRLATAQPEAASESPPSNASPQQAGRAKGGTSPAKVVKAPVGGSKRPRAPSLPTSAKAHATAPGKAFKSCTHGGAVSRDAVWPTLNRPVLWGCSQAECACRADVVVCLTCGHAGCGRQQPGQHALKHFRANPSHTLGMHLPDGTVFCYKCDEWVLPDAQGADPRGDIGLLRQQLHILTDGRVAGLTTRRGTAATPSTSLPSSGSLPGLPPRALQLQRLSDLYQTAVVWHRRLTLAKVFFSWNRARGGRSTAAATVPLQRTRSTAASASGAVSVGSEAEAAGGGAAPPSAAAASQSTSGAVSGAGAATDPSGSQLAQASQSLTQGTVALLDSQLEGPPSPPGAPDAGYETDFGGWSVVSGYWDSDSGASSDEGGARGASAISAAIRRHKKLPRGRTGMKNLGNTCYINAVTQVLVHTRRWKRFFTSLQQFAYSGDTRIERLTGAGAAAAVAGAARSGIAPRATPGHGLRAPRPAPVDVSSPGGMDSSVLAAQASPVLGMLSLERDLASQTAPDSALQPPPPSGTGSGMAGLGTGVVSGLQQVEDEASVFLLSAPPRLVRQATSEVFDDMSRRTSVGGDSAGHRSLVVQDGPRPAKARASRRAPGSVAAAVRSKPRTTIASVAVGTSSQRTIAEVANTTPSLGPKAADSSVVDRLDLDGSESSVASPCTPVQTPAPDTAATPSAPSTTLYMFHNDVHSLTILLSAITRLVWSGRWAVITPGGLVRAVWRLLPHFRSYAQQDAQEFFTSILDELNEELLRGGAPKPPGALPRPAADARPMSTLLAPLATDTLAGVLGAPTGTGAPSTGQPTALHLLGGGRIGLRKGARSRAAFKAPRALGETQDSPAPSPTVGKRPRADEADEVASTGRKGSSTTPRPKRVGLKTRGRAAGASSASKQPPPTTAKPSAQAVGGGKRSRSKAAGTTKGAGVGSPPKRPKRGGKAAAKAASPQSTGSAKSKPRPSTPKAKPPAGDAAGKRQPRRTTRPSKRVPPKRAAQADAVTCAAGAESEAGEAGPSPPKDAATSTRGADDQVAFPRFPASAFVRDTLQGATATIIRCDTCGKESVTQQHFTSLSLDVDTSGECAAADDVEVVLAQSLGVAHGTTKRKAGRRGGSGGGRRGKDAPAFSGPISLSACLRRFAAVEALEGDCAYACEACGSKQPARKQVLISRLPRILALHLNRAQWTLHGAKEKVQAHVCFSLRGVSFSDVCVGGRLDMRQGLQEQCPPPPAQRPYCLAGMVQHEGRGIDRGHYVAYCWQPHAIGSALDAAPDSADDSDSSGSATREAPRRPVLAPLTGRAQAQAAAAALASPASVRLRRRAGGPAPRGAWHRFDDEKVTPCQREDVLGAQAFILLYELER